MSCRFYFMVFFQLSRTERSKTKELVFNFRKCCACIDNAVIEGQAVEITSEYKYLGTIIGNKLDWKSNNKYAYGKAHKGL